MTNLGRLLGSSSSSAASLPILLSALLRRSPFRPLCTSTVLAVSSSSLMAVEGERGERMSCSCCLMNSSVVGSDIQCRNRSCSGEGCSVSTSMAAADSGRGQQRSRERVMSGVTNGPPRRAPEVSCAILLQRCD